MLILGSGTFLGIVLFIYKAFGIDQGLSFSGHSLLERVLLFALAASLTYAFNELILRPKIQTTSRYKQVGWIAWEIISAGPVVFLLFDYFWDFTETNLSSYLLLIGEFASVMLIPHLIAGIVAQRTNKSRQLFVLASENLKDKLTVPLEKLMYIKAEDNYVNVYYRLGSAVQSKLLRKKLSDLENERPELLRVHRSYLVNPQTDLNVAQNAKGVEILFDVHHKVPVSNSYRHQLEVLDFHPA